MLLNEDVAASDLIAKKIRFFNSSGSEQSGRIYYVFSPLDALLTDKVRDMQGLLSYREAGLAPFVP